MPLYDYKCPECGVKDEVLILVDNTSIGLIEILLYSSEGKFDSPEPNRIRCVKCQCEAVRLPSEFGKHLSCGRWNAV